MRDEISGRHGKLSEADKAEEVLGVKEAYDEIVKKKENLHWPKTKQPSILPPGGGTWKLPGINEVQ